MPKAQPQTKTAEKPAAPAEEQFTAEPLHSDNLPALAGPIIPRGIAEIRQYAEMIKDSDFIPQRFKGKAGDICVAIMYGLELHPPVAPLAALQGLAVINGSPTIYGDLARALVLNSPLLEDLHETDPAEVRATGVARCVIKRRDKPTPFVGEFSMQDAERALQWNSKEGEWVPLSEKQTYKNDPVAMLSWRAFHRARRKAFSDIFAGLKGAEEAYDYDIETTATPVEDPHAGGAGPTNPQQPPPTTPQAAPAQNNSQRPPMPPSAYPPQDVKPGAAPPPPAQATANGEALVGSEELKHFWPLYRVKWKQGDDRTVYNLCLQRRGLKSISELKLADYKQFLVDIEEQCKGGQGF